MNRLISRSHAKTRRRKGGRERGGNLAGKQETAGKQEESRFNHRGPPRGTEGEGKKGKTMFNIQQGIFNFQERLYFLSKNGLRKKQNEKRVLKTQFGRIVVQRFARLRRGFHLRQGYGGQDGGQAEERICRVFRGFRSLAISCRS